MEYDENTEKTQTHLCRAAMSGLTGSPNEKAEERKGGSNRRFKQREMGCVSVLLYREEERRAGV